MGRLTATESTANLSISCWVTINSTGRTNAFCGRATTAVDRLYFMTQSGPGNISVRVGDSDLVYTTSLVVDTWYHVVMVYDGSLTGNTNRVKVYINGAEDTNLTDTGTVLSTTSSGTSDFGIGGLPAISSFDIDGKMDEFAYFDYSLSSSEVTDIYNSGVPTDLMDLAAAKRPEHYYRADNDTYPTISDIGETGTADGTMSNQESSDINGDVPY